MSAGHAHGFPGAAVANDGVSVERSSVLPLLVLVVGLAAATVWLVALPLLDRSPRAERPCEVYVMPSGKVKCVPTSTGSSAAKKPKPKPARRAKR